MMLTVATLLMVLMLSVAGQWEIHSCNFTPGMKCYTKWPKESFHMICPPGFLVAAYKLFDFYTLKGKVTNMICLSSGTSEDCRMSRPLNILGQSFDFKCHEGAAMTAVKYNYNHEADDGIFEVECCKFRGKTVTNCDRWGEETHFAQYLRAASAGKYGFPYPAISGFTSNFLQTYGWTYNYKTRQFILDMCLLK